MSIDLSQRTGRDIKINRLVHIRHASTTVHEYTCLKKKIGCVIKINNTGQGQCRGLKTKKIENQDITTL